MPKKTNPRRQKQRGLKRRGKGLEKKTITAFVLKWKKGLAKGQKNCSKMARQRGGKKDDTGGA